MSHPSATLRLHWLVAVAILLLSSSTIGMTTPTQLGSVTFGPAVALSILNMQAPTPADIDIAPSCMETRVVWSGAGGEPWVHAVARGDSWMFGGSVPPFDRGIVRAVRATALPDGRYLYVWSRSSVGIVAVLQNPNGTWERPVVLWPIPEAFWLDMARDGNEVFLAWSDGSEVSAGRIELPGLVLRNQTRLDGPSLGGIRALRLLAQKGELFAVWQRQYYSNSTVGYVQWAPGSSPSIAAFWNATGQPAYYDPDLAVFPNGTVLITFADPLRGTLLLSGSNTFGPEFDFGSRLGAEHSGTARIAIDPEAGLNVLLLDGNASTLSAWIYVKYARSMDAGATFTPLVQLSNSSSLGSKFAPAIRSGENGQIYIGWDDSPDGFAPRVPYVVRGRLPTPKAVAHASTSLTSVGSPVTFDGSASESAGHALSSYTWDFGDGATAAGSAVSHAYATPGLYVARLTIADDRMIEWNTCLTVRVYPSVGLTPYHHAGFRISAPEGWRTWQDSKIGGLQVELGLNGVSPDGFAVNLTVDAQSDSIVATDPQTLEMRLEWELVLLRGTYPDARMAMPPEDRLVDGLSAAVAVVDLGNASSVWKMAIVANATLNGSEYWYVRVAVDRGGFATVDPLYELILSTFAPEPPREPAVNGGSPATGPVVIAAAGVAVGGAGAAVAVLLIKRKARGKRPSPDDRKQDGS